MGKSPCLMGKSTINHQFFHSYVSLAEGTMSVIYFLRRILEIPPLRRKKTKELDQRSKRPIKFHENRHEINKKYMISPRNYPKKNIQLHQKSIETHPKSPGNHPKICRKSPKIWKKNQQNSGPWLPHVAAPKPSVAAPRCDGSWEHQWLNCDCSTVRHQFYMFGIVILKDVQSMDFLRKVDLSIQEMYIPFKI